MIRWSSAPPPSPCRRLRAKIVDVVADVLPRSAFPASAVYVDHSPRLLLPGPRRRPRPPQRARPDPSGRASRDGHQGRGRPAAASPPSRRHALERHPAHHHPRRLPRQAGTPAAASAGSTWGFYGGVIPGNTDQLLPLVEAGVRGFKGFLIEIGGIFSLFFSDFDIDSPALS